MERGKGDGDNLVTGVKNDLAESSVSGGGRGTTYVHVWIKFHGVRTSAFTAHGLSDIATRLGTPVMSDSCNVTTCVQSWGRMDYARALVDIRVDRAFKDTMVFFVPNPDGNGVTMHTIERKGVRAPHVSKHSTGGNYSLPKQRVPKSAYQKKTNSTLVSNSFSTLEEDNDTPMDDLVDGTKKKIRSPPMKTDIWSGKKGKYSLESCFTSPNPFDLLTKNDGNSMLRGLYESDDVPDEDDGSDETAHSSKSMGNSTGRNT
nr:hypothetical protein [Tanacetum cinerariifolium]